MKEKVGRFPATLCLIRQKKELVVLKYSIVKAQLRTENVSSTNSVSNQIEANNTPNLLIHNNAQTH